MSDQHEVHERRGFPWVAALLVALPVAIVCYPLSLGPVLWVYLESGPGERHWLVEWLLDYPLSPLMTYANSDEDLPLKSEYSDYLWWWMRRTP